MTESEAKAKLKLMILDTEDPELSDAQVVDCLAYARRPDADGNVYEDDDWTPTWNLDAAAAEGWRRKASLAAGLFNFAEDSQRFDRAQIYAHCTQQADYYARKDFGSIPVSDSTTTT